MNRTVARVGAVLVLLMAGPSGCGGHTQTGTLSGRALQYGGPLNPTTGKQALNGTPGGGIVVSVVTPGHTASATTGPDGEFSFQLHPGRYTVTGCVTTTVQVHAGQHLVHDLVCPVP